MQLVAIGEAVNLAKRSAPAGVDRLAYSVSRAPTRDVHPYLRNIEAAVLRGQAVARVAMELRRKGFVPDVICVHPAWGKRSICVMYFPKAACSVFSSSTISAKAPMSASTRNSPPHWMTACAYAPGTWCSNPAFSLRIGALRRHAFKHPFTPHTYSPVNCVLEIKPDRAPDRSKVGWANARKPNMSDCTWLLGFLALAQPTHRQTTTLSCFSRLCPQHLDLEQCVALVLFQRSTDVMHRRGVARDDVVFQRVDAFLGFTARR